MFSFLFFLLKGIVHPKMKFWCLSAYPQGIQDVGDFVSSVEHKWRFLTQTVAVCQSYNGSQWYSYTDKRKLNPAARDDTLRSKDMKRSVCARNWTVFILFFTSDPQHGPTLLSAFTTASAWRIFFFFLLYSGSQTYKCITATYLSNRFVSLDLNVSSRAAGFNLVLSLYVFSLSKPWIPLTAIIWLTDCNGLS